MYIRLARNTTQAGNKKAMNYMGILASHYAHTIEREKKKKTGSVRLSNFMSNSRRLYPKKGIDSHKLDSVMHLIS